MAIRFRFTALVLALILSGILASPVFALEREGPRSGDRIVRVIKQLLARFGIAPNDSLGTVKP